MDSERVCEISLTALIMTLVDGTSRQVSVELCLLPVPLDAVEGVPAQLVVAAQHHLAPELGPHQAREPRPLVQHTHAQTN